MLRLPALSTLFPYTTLFRSGDMNWLPVDGVEATLADLERGENFATLAELEGRVVGGLIYGWANRYPRHATGGPDADRKSTRLNSSHLGISYAVFCLKKKKKE